MTRNRYPRRAFLAAMLALPLAAYASRLALGLSLWWDRARTVPSER